MKITRRKGISLIFGKDAKEVYENLIGSIKRQWGFTDIYIYNAFVILLSHSTIEKYIEDIIRELLKNRADEESIKIKQKLQYMRFKDKIILLYKSGLFKKKSMVLARLRHFSITRNAFGHLYPIGHKSYKDFFQSYDISQKMLTVGKYNKIAKLQDMLEYVLSQLKSG